MLGNLNQRGSQSERRRGSWRDSNYRGRTPRGNYHNTDRTWHRQSPKQIQAPTSLNQEHYIQMEPSKMMTAKEKEWIFKISLMSLLSGDANISDYYFIVSY